MATVAKALRAGFIDDDPKFIRTMQVWQEGVEMPVRATTSVEELLDWVRSRDVEVAVSDLRMPGRDGVAVLEEVHRINPDVSLVILTSFDPKPDEQERLGIINATVYFKTPDLPRFLDTLLAPKLGSTNESAQRLAELQGRIFELEKMNREWAEDLVMQLREVPDLEKALVSTGSEKFTVAELIDDIINLRPRGVEHIRLWRSALARLRRIGRV